MLQFIGNNNTRKGQMHLQKCNVKIWNALAKVQSQHSEPPLTSPEKAKKTLQKVLSEGECEFWDGSCPGFAPNPFCFSFWVWGFLWFFLVGRSGRCRLRGVARLALLCFAVCMHNACITIDGGRWPRQPPPPLGSSQLLSLSLLGF